MKKLIPDEALATATHLPKHNPLLHLLSKVAKIDKVNDLYEEICKAQGIDFIDAFFDELQLEIEYKPSDLENIPTSGGFISVANHPFGAIDGLALLKVIQQVRPDYKVMANFLLQNIEPIKDCFVAVNPFESNKSAYSNIAGLKAAIHHIDSGIPLGIFPAGEVSTFNGDFRSISDRKWQNAVIKIIRNAEVPVLPMYFDGANSYIFHLLGLIHPGLRTLALPSEMLRKKGKTIRLKIGKPIMPKDFEMFKDIDQLGRYLRAKTYALGSSLDVKKDYFRHLRFPPKAEEIVPPVDNNVIENEIAGIEDRKTISYDNFDCYVAESSAIPGVLREIGRLREVTFRSVGEGTNKSIDLDEYDFYYHHLILWDREAKKIAGAYRIGDGQMIMMNYGLKGFYTTSLFKMNYRMKPIMAKSLELGRSFIVNEYQRHRLPLFLLWKGILFYLLAHPHFRYIIGPVSISNSYQDISKGLIIEFIKRHYFDPHLSRYVEPRHAYKPRFSNVDTDVLVQASQADLKKMDKIISEIEPSSFSMPVLLKKYLQQNARILAFNCDPKFNNALDGLMILDIMNLPTDTVEALRREMVES